MWFGFVASVLLDQVVHAFIRLNCVEIEAQKHAKTRLSKVSFFSKVNVTKKKKCVCFRTARSNYFYTAVPSNAGGLRLSILRPGEGSQFCLIVCHGKYNLLESEG